MLLAHRKQGPGANWLLPGQLATFCPERKGQRAGLVRQNQRFANLKLLPKWDAAQTVVKSPTKWRLRCARQFDHRVVCVH
ncbi:hypothetical protein CBM2629_A60054 [Cupriavidus taiwanensis]|nr:hypothetical protein CBM2629_A60054 [Cupriavidus taiwanensis]